MKKRLCLYVLVLFVFSKVNANNVPDVRPSTKRFISDAVESYLSSYIPAFRDANLALLFSNTFAYTLDNTVFANNVDQGTGLSDLRTFIVTGDIKAMWIRDSINQLAPLAFLIPFDMRLFRLFTGLINTQTDFLNEDLFANAFVVPGGAESPNSNDHTYRQFRQPGMTKHGYERKFEADSLAAHLKLQRVFLTSCTDEQITELFNSHLNWSATVVRIVDLLIAWTGDPDLLMNPDYPYYYYFIRPGAGDLDTLKNGTGIPEKVTGMVRTLFRPSDDASKLPFNIPVNSMLAFELSALAAVYQRLNMADKDVRNSMLQLSGKINAAIQIYGTVMLPDNSCQYSYEVDGFGNRYFIDDANYPSLLAMPLFAKGIYSEKCYSDTRPKILSKTTNDFYFLGEGDITSGVGSPHTGNNHIWPLSLIAQARTTSDPDQKTELINALVASSGTTGLIHESYLTNAYSQYTRSGFAWGNAAFAELIAEILKNQPALLLKNEDSANGVAPL